MGPGQLDKVRTVLAKSWNANCIVTAGRGGGDGWLPPLDSWGTASQPSASARKSLAVV